MKTKIRPVPAKALLASALLAACTSFLIYALRINAVYIDTTVFSGFSALLFGGNILTAVVLFVLFLLKAYTVQWNGTPVHTRKAFRVLEKIALVFMGIFFLYVTFTMIFSDFEMRARLRTSIGASILPFAATLSILLLVWGLPLIQKAACKRGIAIALTCVLALSAVLTLFPCYTYKFLSDPMVIDNGESYSVVFATNDTGTGFAEYTYQGKAYKVYDEAAGRLKNSTIHTVEIPKAHLNGNSYRVGSTRVIEERSYGGRSGKSLLSKDYAFTVPSGEQQTYLTVSDWHMHTKEAYKAIANVGEYDGVILLGDAVPGLECEKEIADYIVTFGGAVSHGVMPILYVRGNHETRGPFASALPGYLGMDSFFYTTDYGDYHFLLLDSGEDKQDSHPEYGGMVNYDAYRANMVEWLEGLEKSEKKTITLVHDSDLCVEDDLRARAEAQLGMLDATEIISGHYHVCKFEQENGFNIYTDGGFHKNEYIASKLTLTKDNYRLSAWNDKGEQVFDKEIAW